MDQSLSERTMFVVRLFSIVFIALAMQAGTGYSKPVQQDLEPIDVCIFTCDFCFTAEALVRCANECIALDGMMGPMWRKTCPYFGQQPLFPSSVGGKLLK